MEPHVVVKAKGSVIRNIYLYLVSFVALMMLIFSAADLINTALRTYIFTKADDMNYYYGPTCVVPVPPAGSTSTPAKGEPGCLSKEEQKKQQDEQRSSQRQSSVVRDISMILVAIPVFSYHWMIIRKKEEKE